MGKRWRLNAERSNETHKYIVLYRLQTRKALDVSLSHPFLLSFSSTPSRGNILFVWTWFRCRVPENKWSLMKLNFKNTCFLNSEHHQVERHFFNIFLNIFFFHLSMQFESGNYYSMWWTFFYFFIYGSWIKKRINSRK